MSGNLDAKMKALDEAIKQSKIAASEIRLGIRSRVTHYLDAKIRLEQYRDPHGECFFATALRSSGTIDRRAAEVTIDKKIYEPLIDDTVQRKVRGIYDLVLPPEPHAEPQNLPDLFEALLNIIDRHVTLSEDFRIGVAAYIVMSGNFDAFEFIPYLQLRCLQGAGKTQAVKVMKELAYHGMRRVSPTPATIYRPIEAYHPTLILDEMPGRMSQVMVTILKAGADRGSPVPRHDGGRDGFKFGSFSPFCPKIFAGQEEFETDQLANRTIIENMAEVTRAAHVPRHLPDAFFVEARAMQARLFRYWLDNTWSVAPVYPEDGDDRGKQAFAPLYASTPERYWPHLANLLKRQTAAIQLVRSESLGGECMRAIIRLGMPRKIFTSDVAAAINHARHVRQIEGAGITLDFDTKDARYVSEKKVSGCLFDLGVDKSERERDGDRRRYRVGDPLVLERLCLQYAPDELAQHRSRKPQE